MSEVTTSAHDDFQHPRDFHHNSTPRASSATGSFCRCRSHATSHRAWLRVACASHQDLSLIQGALGFSRTFPGLKGHMIQPHTPCWIPLNPSPCAWTLQGGPVCHLVLEAQLHHAEASETTQKSGHFQHSHLGLNIWCHHCTCLERAPGRWGWGVLRAWWVCERSGTGRGGTLPTFPGG